MAFFFSGSGLFCHKYLVSFPYIPILNQFTPGFERYRGPDEQSVHIRVPIGISAYLSENKQYIMMEIYVFLQIRYDGMIDVMRVENRTIMLIMG